MEPRLQLIRSQHHRGFEPGTARSAGQCLTHCATKDPRSSMSSYIKVYTVCFDIPIPTVAFHPFTESGFFRVHSLDRSISHFRGVKFIFYFFTLGEFNIQGK